MGAAQFSSRALSHSRPRSSMSHRVFTDVDAFREHVTPFLCTRAAHNTLMLGALVAATQRPKVQPATPDAVRPFMASVSPYEDDPNQVAAVVMYAPPYPLLLSVARTARTGVWFELCELCKGLDPHAVTGDVRTVNAFVKHSNAVRDDEGAAPYVTKMQQQLWVCTAPTEPRPAAIEGTVRAVRVDEDLAHFGAWHARFGEDVGLTAHIGDAETCTRRIRPRAERGDLFAFYDASGAPRAMAMRQECTPALFRMNALFTPREDRGKGLGSALTYALVRDTLARDGVAEVCLFVDTANETSQHVYRRVGFECVEDRVLLERAAE